MKLLVYSNRIEVRDVLSFLLDSVNVNANIAFNSDIDDFVADAITYSPDVIAMKLDWYLIHGISYIKEMSDVYDKKYVLKSELPKSYWRLQNKCIEKESVAVSVECLLKSLLEYIDATSYPISEKVINNISSYFVNISNPQRIELTKSEKKVLKQLANGSSYKMIAGNLDISIETVKTHVRNMYRKLGVNNCTSAVSLAIREDII